MFLVVGLAVAGLAGIAAAFYFSIRSGNRRDRRLRSAGAGRGRSARAGTMHTGAARTGAARAGAARTGTGHGRAGLPPGSRVAAARPGRAVADRRLADGLEPDDDETRPRRRVGFRKGTDLDEELWPTEAFGGVSDEQFWDDLAADKPLATTARAAQPGSETRRRPLDTGSATGPQPLHAKGEDRVRGDGRRGAGSSTDSGPNYGAYPGSRTVPNAATERTMSQPAYTATQPVPTMTPQVPVAPQPAETRGRRRASSAEEDPLTSAAFALRASGPVDGRSSLRSGGSRSGGSGTGPASTYGGTSYAGTSYGDYARPSAATQAMSTPPSGQDYGYASRGTVPPGGDPRRHDDSGSHARHAGMGEQTRPVRQVHPQDGYQGTGSYPSPGYAGDGYRGDGYPGTGGYPAGGYQGNGQYAPHDPRDDYRRLTHQS